MEDSCCQIGKPAVPVPVRVPGNRRTGAGASSGEQTDCWGKAGPLEGWRRSYIISSRQLWASVIAQRKKRTAWHGSLGVEAKYALPRYVGLFAGRAFWPCTVGSRFLFADAMYKHL